MSKLRIALLLAVLMVLASSTAAWAGIEKNPNVFVGEQVSCENGFTSDDLYAVGRAGHLADSSLGGVVQAVYILDGPGGDPVATLFDVPGKGLDGVTTWCEWFGEGLWFGGEVILRGNLR